MHQSRISDFFVTENASASASTSSATISSVIDRPIEWYTLYFDGGSRGNPGNSGSGSILFNSTKEVIWENATNHGIQTNNYAEYQGLLIGLKQAAKLGITHLIIRGDSLLAIQQMNGKYKCKHPNILPLFRECCEWRRHIPNLIFEHVLRHLNRDADRLSNVAMDQVHKK
jgi:ribonuclease HI